MKRTDTRAAEIAKLRAQREELADVLAALDVHLLAGYAAVLPAQVAVIKRVRTLLARIKVNA